MAVERPVGREPGHVDSHGRIQIRVDSVTAAKRPPTQRDMLRDRYVMVKEGK